MQSAKIPIDERLAGKEIARLNEPTQAKLRSTQILTTLPQIVSELIQNSLDAQASHINVGVNCEEWVCWVRDDGLGISRQDLESFGTGDDTMRYRTSKDYTLGSTNTVSAYGFRGEALASAAQVSCLEIASRSAKARTTWSVIKKADQLLYKGEAVRWRRETPGTVVCVRDAFFNLPVRRAAHPSASKTWDLVRQEVEVYALVSPPVSFTLEDLRKSQEIGTSNRTIRIPKTLSILSTFRHLYGRALTEQVETIDEAIDGNLRAQGFISLHGASSRIYQFLYINSHPITLCDLHRLIDAQFSLSDFGKNSLDDRSEGGSTRLAPRSSPRKTEKKPVYVLNILVPPGEVDNSFDPAKNIVGLKNKTSVVSLLTHLTRGFLAKHGFIDEILDGVHENPRIRTNGALLKRRRVVIGESHDTTDGSYLPPELNIRHLSLQSTFSHVAHDADLTPSRHRRAGLGECHLIYSSGIPPSQSPAPGLGEFDTSEPGITQRRTIPVLTLRSRSYTTSTSVPTWLRGALEANTSYALSEPTMPAMSPSSRRDPHTTDHSTQNTAQHHYCQSADLPLANQNLISAFFAKKDLSLAKIIGQIDKKFIACMIAHPTTGRAHNVRPENDPITSGTSTPVLIDQHAADERVRVENFLKELCLGFLSTRDEHIGTTRGIRIKSLAPPKPILLTIHELRFLNSSEAQQAFRSWGICFTGYTMPDSRADHPASDVDNLGLGQVLVETIPDIVSDKLLQEEELQDLVKGFLAQLREDLPSFSSSACRDYSEETDQEFLWLKAVRYCPRSLLDLINSKACRGAIMFNDSLTLAQCKSLVQRLALTAYPFQCAHGRPSLVPLIELGPQTGNLGQRRALSCDWSKLEVRG